jgi:hypothetical protein
MELIEDAHGTRLVFLLATPHSALMFAASTILAMRTTPPRAGAGAFVQVHLTNYLQSGCSAAQADPRPFDAPGNRARATVMPRLSSPLLTNIEMSTGGL